MCCPGHQKMRCERYSECCQLPLACAIGRRSLLLAPIPLDNQPLHAEQTCCVLRLHQAMESLATEESFSQILTATLRQNGGLTYQAWLLHLRPGVDKEASAGFGDNELRHLRVLLPKVHCKALWHNDPSSAALWARRPFGTGPPYSLRFCMEAATVVAAAAAAGAAAAVVPAANRGHPCRFRC